MSDQQDRIREKLPLKEDQEPIAPQELEAEELEPVIAPRLAANHNEMFLS